MATKEQMLQEAQDAKDAAKAEAAYNAAMVNTPAAPKVEPKPKKMASGGSVSSASKRADGCATKGKTRGKMC